MEIEMMPVDQLRNSSFRLPSSEDEIFLIGLIDDIGKSSSDRIPLVMQPCNDFALVFVCVISFVISLKKSKKKYSMIKNGR